MSEATPAVETVAPASDENDNREKPNATTEENTNNEEKDLEETADDENKEKEDGLDDDQREDNPAYIPRDKRYYMHDSRVSSSEAEEEGEEAGDPDKRKSRADGAWAHDRFDERWQRPKTRKQLVTKYGFDIRYGENGEEIKQREPEKKTETEPTKASNDRDDQPQKVERAPVKISVRGRGRGRGRGAYRSARPVRQEENDEQYEDEEEEVTEVRRPIHSTEQRGGRRRLPPPRNQGGFREERQAVSGRGRIRPRGGFSSRTPREVEEEYDENPEEREQYRERPSQFRRGGRGQRVGPTNDRPNYAPQVPYRQRGVPTRGGGGSRYPPRGNGYSAARGSTQYERDNGQGYGARAFHNQSYSRGGGRRNDAPARREDQQSFRNNDRDFPPLSRGPQQGSTSQPPQKPVFDPTRPPPMPTRGPKRYSTQPRTDDQGPDNQFIPRQPTAVVYFDPTAQAGPRAPPAPRPKKIIDIVPPKR